MASYLQLQVSMRGACRIIRIILQQCGLSFRPAKSKLYGKRKGTLKVLESIVEKMVGEEHWLFLTWYRGRFGFLPAIRAYVHLLRNSGVGRAPNPLTGGYVFLRPGTMDQAVYNDIFIGKQYDIDFGNPLFIIDAGAHIGLSSIFFANKYPVATIVAIEPEPSNFKMLLLNTASYTNIKPIQAGLWSRKAHLVIQDSDVATWSFRVLESPSGEGIPAIGVQDVMSDFRVTQIDILKIDIEGAELEVLNYPHPWIDAVKTMIIELHDRFQPGCSEALDKALSGYNYDKSKSGMNTVITNLKRIAT